LLDPGSASTFFSTDALSAIGLTYEPDDPLHCIHGIGGSDFVFMKRVNQASIGEREVHDFAVEVGGMDYGFQLDGLVGTDLLLAVGAVIDLATLEIR